MKKIVYVVSTLGRSGPTNQLFNLIKYIDKSSFSVNIITFSPEPEQTRWKDFKDLDVSLTSLSMSRLKGMFFLRKELMFFLKKERPDIIHSQGFRADFLVSLIRTNSKKLCTIHNFPKLDYRMTYGVILGGIMSFIHLIAMRKFNLRVAVSDAVKKCLINDRDVGEVVSIPNGVDTELFRTNSSKKSLLKRKLLLGDNDIVFISSGHLVDRKDPLFLIDAFSELIKKNKRLKLILLGDGLLKRQCEFEIESEEGILSLGHVDNVSDYLLCADYYVSASKAEGLPYSVIEALACGLPLLISNISPHIELMHMGGEGNLGFLYELSKKEDFIKKINLLLSANRSLLADNAIKLVDERLNSKIMASLYERNYFDIISGEPSH
ncbi:glycosyltransferase family 4 protein [Pectobacterium parmentieri]|uniref:glycosyltransferase family 4 protein n=1 Tax=Pectobacterium parmentieri TaxID=1905730 RepID=UPI000A705B66|nr:glycosyltransferase family 4 protein [Pectobacterium parmentieri]MBI0428600.1 glycosyltransferase family 4 protein [Pectobacterium parmentieri]